MAVQSKAIHIALKKRIRTQGKTYADAAEILNLSEPSIRRLFSTAGLSLNRLETLCNWLGLDIKEIVLDSELQQPLITQLTLQQEKEFVNDHRLLLVTYLVLNHWKEHEIKDTFDFSEAELNKHFIKLEKIGLIELLPFNRIRLLTARNFKWSDDGPVQKFFNQEILTEFLKTKFSHQDEKLHFVGGMLTDGAIHKMHEKLDEVTRYFDQLISNDLKIPANKRSGVAMMLGFRKWGFAKLLGVKRKN